MDYWITVRNWIRLESHNKLGEWIVLGTLKNAQDLNKGAKMKIVITVENEEHKQAIIDLLESAENDGNLDFVFNVEIKGA